ncbi:rod shape-determining protein MreC [Nocardioides sp. DS6]|uniref:Cell shape-determining protein MreC n=1 Tax=Nocardioides eburneus TaxID=3231482 RepID=A0ABV3SZB0_9ACTN
MALLTPPPLRSLGKSLGSLAPRRDHPLGAEGLNRRGSLEPKDPRSPKRATLVALLLAGATLMTLDQTPVLEPVRSVAGDVFGPAESAASTVAHPLTDIPGWFDSRDKLRGDITDLKAENADLRRQLRTTDFGRNRLEEYDGLTRSAETLGYSLVPARVVAYGEAQSFSHTVTIDAGTDSGVTADMTVIAADGLVGRVLRATRTTATVLLIVDASSVVGGRVGDSMQVGFAHGSGEVSKSGGLDLELVDQSVAPVKGETVVTWGDGQAAPYVAGVPIGRVTGVFASVRDSSRTVRVQPYVDFGALDVVGVVVPAGTKGDRAVIGSDGKLG